MTLKLADPVVAVDIDFQIPARQCVRFTRDVVDQQIDVLWDVLRPGGDRPPRVMLVADAAVACSSDRLNRLRLQLDAHDGVTLVLPSDGESTDGMLTIPGGEAVKNDRRWVEVLLNQIHDNHLDRRSYIVVVGGGAVLDVVGYAAAIAHRGIRLVRLPTTTLAQADSGVGVKNAINHFGKKNWIGTFAVPWAVINDAALLNTLPDREFRSGFSEAIKVSLLKSRDDFDWLSDHASRIAARDDHVSAEAMRRSCIWHLRHITGEGSDRGDADPFETREARPLDFGHWSAHRLESLSDYQIQHGEAVGIGVAIDCVYSHLCHGFPWSAAERVCMSLSALGLSLDHELLGQPERLLEGLEEFRQHLGGRLTVTMLRDIGDPVDVHHIDRAAMLESIRRVRGWEESAGSSTLRA
ncbi:MAG: 3-dehydroquinate synthase [Planctomycetota bacterium]